MRHSKTPVIAKLAALAAALALQGGAMAATSAAPDSAAPANSQQQATADSSGHHARGHMRAGKHHRHHHMAMLIPGYGPVGQMLVQSLNLNPSQTKLLDEARNAQKTQWEARRKAMSTARQDRKAQLDAGKLDPHAAMQALDARRQQAQGDRQQLNQKWLAVWDALDSAQQQKVAAYLKERADKRQQRAERHRHESNGQKPATDKAAS